ncbi:MULTISPECIES: hypothetical protein [Phenylobacterium]|uniref:Uncharacterized protein n=1 Tax=Phenylobacterium koreense TaxID=266125 RepID=A0ABV2EIC8_9CAUL
MVAVTAPPAGRRLSELVGVGFFLVMLATLPAWLIYETWSLQEAERRAWDISGPPCPVVAHGAAFAADTPYEFSYGGARFARRFGHASCASPLGEGLIPGDPYRVCQFTGPAMVAVATERGVTVFKPGVGHRATVTVRDGKASCVVGGWFGT